MQLPVYSLEPLEGYLVSIAFIITKLCEQFLCGLFNFAVFCVTDCTPNPAREKGFAFSLKHFA